MSLEHLREGIIDPFYERLPCIKLLGVFELYIYCNTSLIYDIFSGAQGQPIPVQVVADDGMQQGAPGGMDNYS